jgi:hypothetical protein
MSGWNMRVHQVYFPEPPTQEKLAADLVEAKKELGAPHTFGVVRANPTQVTFLERRDGNSWRFRDAVKTIFFDDRAYQYNYRSPEEEEVWLLKMLREREGYSLLLTRSATNPWTDEHYFPVYTCSAPHDYDHYRLHRELRAHCGFRYCFDTKREERNGDDEYYVLCAKYDHVWPEYAVKMVPRPEGCPAPPDAWDPAATLVNEPDDDDADVPQPFTRWADNVREMV